MTVDEQRTYRQQMREWANALAQHMMGQMGNAILFETLISLAFHDFERRTQQRWHVENYMRYVFFVQDALIARGGVVIREE